MKIGKSTASFALVFVLIAGLAFAGGVVYARTTFPSLERAVGDYGTLSSDLKTAIDEINRKKQLTEKQETQKKMDQHIHDLLAAFERMTEDQKHTNDIWRDLESLFASDGKDTSPGPERRRP